MQLVYFEDDLVYPVVGVLLQFLMILPGLFLVHFLRRMKKIHEIAPLNLLFGLKDLKVVKHRLVQVKFRGCRRLD